MREKYVKGIIGKMVYLCGCCEIENESRRKIDTIVKVFFENSLEIVSRMSESDQGRVILQSLIITLCAPFLSCCI